MVISRALARQFHAVVRRSLQDSGQARAWPLLLCRTGPHGVSLEAHCGDRSVRYQEAPAQPPAALAFRSSVLAQLAGRAAAPVSLECLTPTQGRARFDEEGVPQSVDFELVAADSVPEWPALPEQLTTLPGTFLTAWQEAVRTSAPAATRFALNHLQLRGQQGELVATDGRQVLVQRGYPFPWPDDVLVPRWSVLGGRELGDYQAIGLGRTEKQVVVRAGPWTLLLDITTGKHFPSVDTVVPRTTGTTSLLQLDDETAAYLLRILPKLPGAGAPNAPVTLDLGQTSVVRARADGQEAATEALLRQARFAGPPLRLAVDRQFLRRALQLGFRAFQFSGAEHPFVCRESGRLYLAMAIGGASAIPPSGDVFRLPPAPRTEVRPPAEKRKNPLMPILPASGPPTKGKSVPPTPPTRGSLNEMIEEAEQLRAVLQDAGLRVSRWLGTLKLHKRQSRAVQAAMASLKDLQLEP